MSDLDPIIALINDRFNSLEAHVDSRLQAFDDRFNRHLRSHVWLFRLCVTTAISLVGVVAGKLLFMG